MRDADGKLMLIVKEEMTASIGDPAWDHDVVLSRGTVVKATRIERLSLDPRLNDWITIEAPGVRSTLVVPARHLRELRVLEALAAQALD